MSAFDPKRTLTTLSRDPRPNVRPTNSSLLIRSATTPDLREGQYLICRNVLLLDLVKEIACVSHQTCEPNQIAINTAKRPSWMASKTCSALTNKFTQHSKNAFPETAHSTEIRLLGSAGTQTDDARR